MGEQVQTELDHGNGDGYLLVARLYTRPNNVKKMDKEWKHLEGKTTSKLERTTRTIATTTIKHETRGKAEAE